MERDEVINISVFATKISDYLDTEVNIEGWKHVVKGKTCEDFLNAPETFRFEDRDWNLVLGWERYNSINPAK